MTTAREPYTPSKEYALSIARMLVRQASDLRDRAAELDAMADKVMAEVGVPEQGLPGESPWEIEHPRQKGSNATRGKDWYVSSRDGFQRGGVECATEAEAIDVRDALNAVANGVPLTAQIAKLVDDINNTFAPRIKDLMAENEKLRAALERPRPALPAPASLTDEQIDDLLALGYEQYHREDDVRGRAYARTVFREALAGAALPAEPAPPLDKCQLCKGKRGGVRGNENIVKLAGLDVVVCDYCHAALRKEDK